MKPKFNAHDQKLLDHIDELYAKRMLSEEEVKLYREQVIYKASWKVVVGDAKRFIIGLAVFITALSGLYQFASAFFGGSK
jgi:hypothetical protein